MPRITDRQFVSEAVRVNSPLWRFETVTRHSVVLITDMAERLWVRYGVAGQIVEAAYTHYDEGKVYSHEAITQRKRERVLKLIDPYTRMERKTA